MTKWTEKAGKSGPDCHVGRVLFPGLALIGFGSLDLGRVPTILRMEKRKLAT